MDKLNTVSKKFGKELDKEWLQLMYEAKQLGVSSEEIKEFLKKNKMQ
ncbi:anti-repressor SinI family protein [Priestia megaterium]